MTTDYKPRFSFEISELQKCRADDLLGDYGIRKNLMGIILDDLLDVIEEKGGLAIGAILTKKLKPRDILPILSKASEVSDA